MLAGILALETIEQEAASRTRAETGLSSGSNWL